MVVRGEEGLAAVGGAVEFEEGHTSMFFNVCLASMRLRVSEGSRILRDGRSPLPDFPPTLNATFFSQYVCYALPNT